MYYYCIFLVLFFTVGRADVLNIAVCQSSIETSILRAVPQWEAYTGHKVNITMFPSYTVLRDQVQEDIRTDRKYDGFVLLASDTARFVDCNGCGIQGSAVAELSQRVNDSAISVCNFFLFLLQSGTRSPHFFVKRVPLMIKKFITFL